MSLNKKPFKAQFRGQLRRGRGEATGFTQVAWVQEECKSKLGFLPYPGTVNIEVTVDVQAEVRRLIEEHGLRLVSTDPAFCDALGLPVILRCGGNAVEGAVIVPLVKDYYSDTMEIIAPLKVTEAFQCTEGDEMEVEASSDILALRQKSGLT